MFYILNVNVYHMYVIIYLELSITTTTNLKYYIQKKTYFISFKEVARGGSSAPGKCSNL